MTEMRGIARGGTELLVEGLRQRVSETQLREVSLSVRAPRSGARHLKPFILWEHQSYDQPSVQCLRDASIRNVIDQYVFVSEWQKGEYLKYFPIPPEKVSVIHNAITPISHHTKPRGPIRLIYTSTPFRGLDVLLDAFALLNRSDVELHIYSGMSLYGRPEEDVRFVALYARACAMPQVFYHGVRPNEEVRHALQNAHIFAYPSTWEETSCVSLIEAMSAGCRAVIPDLGGLPETASGFAQLYAYEEDKTRHAKHFAEILRGEIDSFWRPAVQERLALQKQYFDTHYSWTARVPEWEAFLQKCIATRTVLPGVSARV